MKKSLVILLALFVCQIGLAGVKINEDAPNFSEKDQIGKVHTLDSFKGKWVVLEWFNEECPYVDKHYGSKNMQSLQAKYTAKEKGVVWLTVASSAEKKQGYVASDNASEVIERTGMKSTALLLDSDGNMAKAYGAKVTPHMFVINPQGKVVYAGAIDSNDSSKASAINGATNYISAALDAGMAGEPVKISSTEPYGCGIKNN